MDFLAARLHSAARQRPSNGKPSLLGAQAGLSLRAAFMKVEHGIVEGLLEEGAEGLTFLGRTLDQSFIVHFIIQVRSQGAAGVPAKAHLSLPPQGGGRYRVLGPGGIPAGGTIRVVPIED